MKTVILLCLVSTYIGSMLERGLTAAPRHFEPWLVALVHLGLWTTYVALVIWLII